MGSREGTCTQLKTLSSLSADEGAVRGQTHASVLGTDEAGELASGRVVQVRFWSSCAWRERAGACCAHVLGLLGDDCLAAINSRRACDEPIFSILATPVAAQVGAGRGEGW